jgi:hypothetical protein
LINDAGPPEASSAGRTTAPEIGKRRLGRLDWPQPTWSWLLIVGLLSRVAVVAWGDWCAHMGPPRSLLRHDQTVAAPNLGYNVRHMTALKAEARRWIQPWYRWDALWYAEVSQAGYNYDPDRQCSTAFLPLLPLVMAAGATLGLDRYWTGFLATNVAFAAGLACFGRAVLRATGDRATAWRACLLLTAYPFAFFYSAPYQESLGFALTAAALLAWLAQRPLAAAVSLALASLARLTTVAMCLALAAEWVNDRIHRRPARSVAWLVALAGGVGFGLFCSYLGVRFGDPLAHLRAHASWGRQPASIGNVGQTLTALVTRASESAPFAAASVAILVWTCRRPAVAALAWLRDWIVGQSPPTRTAPGRPDRPARRRAGRRALERTSRRLAAEAPPSGEAAPEETRGWLGALLDVVALACVVAALGIAIPGSPMSQIFNMTNSVASVFFLGLGVHAWWRRGPFWGCLVLVPVLQGMATGSVFSMNRIVLASFPAFLDLAELLRPRLMFAAWMLASIFAQGVLIDWFVNWRFLS